MSSESGHPNASAVETIFNAALVLPVAERPAYLAVACGDNREVRHRVETLLGAHEASQGFLPDQPGVGCGMRLPVIGLDGTELVPVTEQPGTVIGRYKLLEKIGEGGMGVVYMAQQEEPVRRKVALKIIKLGMDTKQVVARFEAERQALALMDHPNIAKVLDAGATDTGRPYFVMELVQGVPITEFCDKNCLPAEERIKLFITVCQAVQSAHQKGIIHRDLKPTNILVTLNAGVPVPMVIDFGVAKATQQKLTEKTLFTQYAAMIGTPAYMSPEQAEMSRLDVDTRSDIFGLGVLLYELLTGTTPFPEKRLRSASYHEMQRIILEEEPDRPSTRLTRQFAAKQSPIAEELRLKNQKLKIEGDLDWIVMKCLEKDRARRYETANGLAADLKRHLNNEPVVARPPSTAYRLQKAWRRNKVAFTAATAVVAALVVGTIVSTWQAIEASKARNAERQQRLAAQSERDKAQTAQKQAELARQSEKSIRLEAEHQLYAAKMNLAQQAWEQNNIGRLRQLLDDTQPYPSRGFEWFFWQGQTHLALKTLQGHMGYVNSVAYSPDGQRIVTGSADRTAKVWEAASGKELFTLKGHTDWISSVVFSPDGQRIVTGSGDGMAKVWDAASGRKILTLRGHSDQILSVAFSPDGRRIVTGSRDKTAKVWAAASGNELYTLKGHSNFIYSVAFSPDGQRIATGSLDQTAKIWEAASGRELVTFKGHSGFIQSVAFSPDGARIVTGSGDNTAKVWEVASGLSGDNLGGNRLTLKADNGRVLSVAFCPDGQRVVTGGDDVQAKVWDVASGQVLFPLIGHSDEIESVAYSSDSRRIVTGSSDNTAKVWEAASGKYLLTLAGHSNRVMSVAYSPDSRRIVTGSSDNTAKVWDAATGRELVPLIGHSDEVWSVAFSPDGQRIVTGSEDKTAKVWDAASGTNLLTLTGHSGYVYSVAFSPDGQRIATGSLDQTARIWEAASGRELVAFKGQSGLIQSVAFSPDGERIVTGSADNTAKVWEAASGRELLTLKGHKDVINSVAFSLDGQRIVTGSNDQTVKVWEAARPEQIAAWQEEEQAGTQHVGTLQAEQERQGIARAARDSIKRWLIMAPIALATGQSGAAGLDIEQIESEGQLRPKVGEASSIAGSDLKWREVALTNGVIDFNALLGQETTQSVAYAVCYLRSEAEQRRLRMLVGSDDEAKVYLNGEQVYKSAIPRPFVAEEDTVPNITLNAGLNVLVFKIVNEQFDWMGSIRFTDVQGNPVNGLQVTLESEGKDLR